MWIWWCWQLKGPWEQGCEVSLGVLTIVEYRDRIYLPLFRVDVIWPDQFLFQVKPGEFEAYLFPALEDSLEVGWSGATTDRLYIMIVAQKLFQVSHPFWQSSTLLSTAMKEFTRCWFGSSEKSSYYCCNPWLDLCWLYWPRCQDEVGGTVGAWWGNRPGFKR